MTFDVRRGERWAGVALIALLLAGTGLRLWQYAANPSLWLDEAAIARNIIERSTAELVGQPLDHGQVAPPGFLVLQKGITSLFGPSELMLRALPLASSLVSLVLFTTLAQRTLSGGAILYAVLLFALGQPFIYFAAQAKQHGVDVAATSGALLLIHRLLDGSVGSRERVGLAAAGALLPFISTPSALVLTGGLSGGLAALWWRGDTALTRRVAPVLAIWTSAGLAAALLAMSVVPADIRSYLDSFWRAGYMPIGIRTSAAWLWGTSRDVFGSFGSPMLRANGGLGYRWPELFAATTAVGFAVLVRQRRDVALMLGGPLLFTCAASVLRLYPARGRLLVFLVPILLLVTAAGAQAVWRWCGDRVRAGKTAVAAVLVALPVFAAVENRPPYSIQPLRDVLERMAPRYRPGDAIHVDYAAAQAFLYYAPRFGLDRSGYVIGRCAVTDRRDYLRQVDRYRGRGRVWIIATHLSAVERSITIGYLERIGVRLESIFVEPAGAPLRFAAYARLYDLSQPELLARSSAASHPIRDVPPDPDVRDWGCGGPLAVLPSVELPSR